MIILLGCDKRSFYIDDLLRVRLILFCNIPQTHRLSELLTFYHKMRSCFDSTLLPSLHHDSENIINMLFHKSQLSLYCFIPLNKSKNQDQTSNYDLILRSNFFTKCTN